MNRADEGHPVGAVLLLCSMFAFAWVFHAVTKRAAELPARFDLQLTTLAGTTLAVVPDVPVIPEVPEVIPGVLVVPAVPVVRLVAERQTVGTPGTSETPGIISGTSGTPGTALASREWLILAALPVTPSAVEPNQHPRDGGALTRAFATTGAALRTAFRKTF